MLVKELQSLGLALEVISEEETRQVEAGEEPIEKMPSLKEELEALRDAKEVKEENA